MSDVSDLNDELVDADEAETDDQPVDASVDVVVAGEESTEVDASDDIIEEEAPLEEPVAEQFSDNGDHLPEIDAIEVVPDTYAEGDEVADEAAALGVEITEEAIVLDATTAAIEIDDDSEAEVELPAEPVDDPSTRPGEWYVVHTQSGYEKKVTANLHAAHPEHEHGGQDL